MILFDDSRQRGTSVHDRSDTCARERYPNALSLHVGKVEKLVLDPDPDPGSIQKSKRLVRGRRSIFPHIPNLVQIRPSITV